MNLFFLIKWYFLGRLRIGRIGRKKKCLEEFHDYVRKLEKGSLAIDVGANIGGITKIFLANGCKVIAFEPDPLAIKEFKKNIGQDINVTLYEKAIGIENKFSNLYRYKEFDTAVPSSTQGSSLLETNKRYKKPHVKVEVTNFINFIKELHSKISILKIDIEGKEIEIINLLIDNNLHNDIGLIVVETTPNQSHNLGIGTAKLRLRLKQNNIQNINLDWV